MAIEKRERKTTGRRKAYSYRVKWRLNGNGPQQGRTVESEAEAIQLEEALRKSGWAYSKDDPEVADLTLIGGSVVQRTETPDLDIVEPTHLTLEEACRRWANRPKLSRGSKRNYLQVVDNRLGEFGNLRVNEVTLRDIEDWLNTQTSSLSASSAFTSQVVVTGALRAQGFASLLEGLDKIKNARQITPIYLEEDQVANLVAWVEDNYGENLAVLTELTATLGPRWGEGVALQLVHTALKKEETAHLWIRQAVKNDARNKDGFKPERAKTINAERMLPLTPHLTTRMRSVTTGLTDSRAVIFRPIGSQVTVRPNHGRGRGPSSASFWNARTFGYRWNAITRSCPDVPDDLRWHDLRHTAAKNMLERGVPISYVSKLLGHSKVEVTVNEYGSFDQRSHDLVRGLLST